MDTRTDSVRRSWHTLVRLGDEILAIKLDSLREIAPPLGVARLPGAPQCVIGLGSWHDQLLPILAAHDLLGMKPFRPTAEARALIFDFGSVIQPAPLCLLVDAVLGTRQFNAEHEEGMVALRCAPITAGWTIDATEPDATRYALLDPGRLRTLLERELLQTAQDVTW